MLTELKELYRYRELLMVLVARDLKVRYKRSALGFMWSLINPLAQMVVLTVIFKFVLGYKIENYSAWVLAAILPWSFFQNSILDAAQSILIHYNLLKKVYFPREIIPLAAVFSNLIHLGLSLLVFFAYALIFPIYHSRALVPPPYWGWMLLWLPAIIVLHTLLNMGLALLVSALNVYYEDVKFIVQILVNLLFYTCPIIYATVNIAVGDKTDPRTVLTPASQHLFFLYRLNPMASLIYLYQKALLSHATPLDLRMVQFTSQDALVVGITVIECVLMAALGYRFFNRRKWEFAERL
jgi:ABC-type polysaccharide/polyol phosphate export permease